MKIKMIRKRDWRVPGDFRVSFNYLAGNTYTVKREWGEVMVADGDAKEVVARKADEQA